MKASSSRLKASRSAGEQSAVHIRFSRLPRRDRRRSKIVVSGIGVEPHTSFAVSMQSLSLAFSCSTVRLLPWWVLEKPHCGDRHRFSSGTYLDACLDASLQRILRFQLRQPSSVTRPSTTFLPLAT